MRRVLWISVVALAACRGGPQGSVAVTDSAGARLTVSADVDRTFATVNPEPLLSLGGVDGAGPSEFFRIAGVHLDPHGNLWVADGGSAELRLFRPDGTHWKTRGGRGDGPGEFRRLALLGAFAGDSVACWDVELARLTVFGPDGEVGRTTRLPPGEEAAPRAYDVFPDGTLLAQFPRLLAGESLGLGQLLRDTARYERVDLASPSRDPLASAPGPVWVWTGHSQIPLPFTINPGVDLDGPTLHLVAGPDFRVRVFQGGRLTEAYGVARARRAVTSHDVATYASFMEDALPEPERREYLSVLDHADRPGYLPAYSHVVVADGTVWARVYSADTFDAVTWDVFDATRRWVGTVRSPAGFTLHQVEGDALVGVWRDSLRVEYVRIYEMQHQ